MAQRDGLPQEGASLLLFSRSLTWRSTPLCERVEESWNRFIVVRGWAWVNLNKVRPVLFIHSDLREQELIANLYKFALPGTWTEIKTWFTTNRKSNQYNIEYNFVYSFSKMTLKIFFLLSKLILLICWLTRKQSSLTLFILCLIHKRKWLSPWKVDQTLIKSKG